MTLRSDFSARRYRLAEIVETIPVPAAVAYAEDPKEVVVNAALAKILGVGTATFTVSAEPGGGALPFHFEIDGRRFTPGDLPLFGRYGPAKAAGVDLEVVRADGGRVHLHGRAAPLPDDIGAPHGSLAVFQNIDELVAAERHARDLKELTPALLFTLDAGGALDSVNRRWSELTGVPAEEFLAGGWQRFVHPDDLERITAGWPAARETGLEHRSELRLRHADGVYRWIRLAVEGARDAAGNVERWFGSAFDIDDLHRALEAMRLLGGVDLAVDDDVPTMLAHLAHDAFDGLADICVFDLHSPETGDLERFVLSAPGIDVSHVRIAASEGSHPSLARADARHPVLTALSQGETLHVPVVTPQFIAEAIDDARIREMWELIGVHSLVVVPLRSSGHTLGTLSTMRTRRGRPPFDVTDLRVIEGIASRAAVAIEKIRLNEALRGEAAELEERYRSIADVMPQLMWTTDAEGRFDWVNRRWYEFVGRSPAAGPDEAIQFVHPDDVAPLERRWLESQATGKPFELEFRMRRHDGVYRWFLTRATCTRDAAGRIARWYGSNTDVDDVRRASRTLQIFADLGESLSESLGFGATVSAAMSIVVPEFADWGFINLIDEDGDLRVAAVYHADPQKLAVLASQVGEVYARGDDHQLAPADGNSRDPRVYRAATLEEAALVVEPGVLDAFWEVGFTSVLAVPLLVSGVQRGTLNVAMYESERAFAENDVPFFRELARRITPAIANAELYERERRVAQSFQNAALPAALPSVAGFRFDAIYEAGRAEALIGGDWYDAFRLVDGRIVISIGDVAGSGLAAAVTMANVRQAIRGVAQVHADPALMLEAADRTLRAETPDRFVTAFVGVIDGVGRTLSYASAGHPPPFVRATDGSIVQLAYGGPPLGLRENVRGGGNVMKLPEDAFMVLYTDGLIESTHDVDEGERRLRAALGDPGVVAAQRPALAIHDAVLIEGSRDDVAILTVAFGDPPELTRWSFDARDAATAHATQREIAQRLRAAGFTEERLVVCELVIAELIGNTVRYAPGPIDVYLERDDDVPVVHVLDRGPGFEFAARLPPDVFSESGRGLFLIATLAEDLHVVRRPDGGSHARVVLR